MEDANNRDERHQLKEYARLLYTRDKLTLEAVSGKTGVHANTIGRWAVAGGWKKLQRNFLLTREEQIANLLDELIELNASIRNKPKGRRFADSREGDVRRKLVRDIKDLETTVSLSEVIGTCKGIVLFVQKNDPSKLRDVANWTDRYIKSLLEPGPIPPVLKLGAE